MENTKEETLPIVKLSNITYSPLDGKIVLVVLSLTVLDDETLLSITSHPCRGSHLQ